MTPKASEPVTFGYMFTTSHHRPTHRRTRRPRTAAVSTAAALAGALALAGAGTAGADDLPSSSDLQSQVNGGVEDSVEYSGYVAGSVGAFFQLPVDQAVFGSAAAGALALCLVLPTADGNCTI